MLGEDNVEPEAKAANAHHTALLSVMGVIDVVPVVPDAL
jgi:hypothetical protein